MSESNKATKRRCNTCGAQATHWDGAQWVCAGESCATVSVPAPPALAEMARQVVRELDEQSVKRQAALMREAQSIQLGYEPASMDARRVDLGTLLHAARASVGGRHFEPLRMECETRLRRLLSAVTEAK